MSTVCMYLYDFINRDFFFYTWLLQRLKYFIIKVVKLKVMTGLRSLKIF